MVKFANWRSAAWLAGMLLMPALMGVATARDTPQAETPPHWEAAKASELLDYIGAIDQQGLSPAHYALTPLQSALASGDALRIEAAATHSFRLVAHDLAEGRVAVRIRGRYSIPSNLMPEDRLARLRSDVQAGRGVGEALDGLTPQDDQYRRLRNAMKNLSAGEPGKRRALRVNLERLRWLPRDPGANRLVVNIPDYMLRLFRNGVEFDRFRVIVGKKSTPTPQFAAQINGVILNPSWQVPRSIIAESVGGLVRRSPGTARARGYVWSWGGGSLQVTQLPGPGNALGRVKLDMPNRYSVYLHDTPDKALFEKAERSFSHGCIRTDRPLDLAALLLADAGIDRAAIDLTVAGQSTKRLALANAVPVYVLYVTAIADADGSVRYLADPYNLDPAIAAALDKGEVR